MKYIKNRYFAVLCRRRRCRRRSVLVRSPQAAAVMRITQAAKAQKYMQIINYRALRNFRRLAFGNFDITKPRRCHFDDSARVLTLI